VQELLLGRHFLLSVDFLCPLPFSSRFLLIRLLAVANLGWLAYLSDVSRLLFFVLVFYVHVVIVMSRPLPFFLCWT